jgi:hypothetical protein
MYFIAMRAQTGSTTCQVRSSRADIYVSYTDEIHNLQHHLSQSAVKAVVEEVNINHQQALVYYMPSAI